MKEKETNTNEITLSEQPQTDKKRKKPSLKLIVIAILCVACLIIGGLVGGLVSNKITGLFKHDTDITVDVVERVIEPASQLITAKYIYHYAEILDDAKKIGKFNLPGTRDLYRIKFEGTITAGYDLSKAKLSVNNDKQLITIKLPKLDLISDEINEDSVKTKTYNDSILNDSDHLKNDPKFRAACKREMEKKAMKDKEFINLARSNAKTTLKSFLTSNGDTKNYTVKVTYTEGK